MKARISAVLIAVSAALVSTSGLAAGRNGPPSPRGLCCTAATVVQPINQAETAALLWLREEEKLARDVYLALGNQWQDGVFNRIATAEQRHFDAIGATIALFALTDPAQAGTGQFMNADLQALYYDLLADGGQSYAQALVVGATIEDLDMRDLQGALAATSNPALQTTYRNLLESSKNHLRMFVLQLRSLGQDYTPQYIAPVLFDAILGN
jgi:hypothetical protein